MQQHFPRGLSAKELPGRWLGVGRGGSRKGCKAAKCQLGVLALAGLHQCAQHLGVHQIVAVHTEQKLAFGQRHAPGPGCGGAAVGLVNGQNARIGPGGAVYAFGAAVGGAIVYQDRLPVLQGLRLQAGQKRRKIFAGVIHRHHHAYKGAGFSWHGRPPCPCADKTPAVFWHCR